VSSDVTPDLGLVETPQVRRHSLDLEIDMELSFRFHYVFYFYRSTINEGYHQAGQDAGRSPDAFILQFRQPGTTSEKWAKDLRTASCLDDSKSPRVLEEKSIELAALSADIGGFESRVRDNDHLVVAKRPLSASQEMQMQTRSG
jgi:hypothetical protein